MLPLQEALADVRKMLGNGKYSFLKDSHRYFGYKKKIKLFEKEVWAYVYVDKFNASINSAKWVMEHEEEYGKMTMAEKSWTEVSFGYFVLLSNKDTTPAELLDDYFGRTEIESVIKTGKEYVSLLPLCKWNATTISGKILLDIIDLIIYLQLRGKMSGENRAVTEMFGNAQSPMCHCDANGTVKIETPNKKVKEFAKALGTWIPVFIKLSELKKMAMGEM